MRKNKCIEDCISPEDIQYQISSETQHLIDTIETNKAIIKRTIEIADKEVNVAWLNSYEKIIRISINLDDNLKHHERKKLEQAKFHYYTSLHFRSMIAANITYKECKDFDHIACDNILISKNFIMAYEDSKTSENLKEFYFYEIIYYTKVSLDIIHKLLVNKNKCINDKEHTNRIHLFRLENSLNMLEEIYHFIDGNKTQVACDQSLQNSLYKEITDLGTALNKYKGDCDKIKLEIDR